MPQDDAVTHHHSGGHPAHHHGNDHAHHDRDHAYVDPADFFNERAREWDTPEKVAFTHQIAEAITETVPLDAQWRALEIGAGTGLLGSELAPRLAHVLLTDVSPGMLEVARERAATQDGRLDVQRWDLTKVPAAEPVDLVLASMVLHHVGDLDGLLANLRASLNPGGWVALVDLDPDPENRYHGEGFGGHHGIDRADLLAKLAALGFEELADRTAGQRTKAKDGVDYVHDIFLVTGHLPA